MIHRHKNISPTISHLSESEEKWFAVYTKYKCEKYIVEQLSKKGIAAYVPLIEKTKRYTSKIKRYQVPLINCYVFVRIKKSDYIRVLETEYVKMFIKQRNDLIAIPENEINTLKQIVGEIANVEIGEFNLSLGDEVEVISGQLTGMVGSLIKMEGKNKFIVQLTSIDVQLAMTVDRVNLRLLKKGVTASEN